MLTGTILFIASIYWLITGDLLLPSLAQENATQYALTMLAGESVVEIFFLIFSAVNQPPKHGDFY